ncbi:hypothetical protein F5Y10DRAFT_243895 [Nemania abortiva]|nr:hypothetical protein F5Y10DRAFT_243895 [Nemania abortiva]
MAISSVRSGMDSPSDAIRDLAKSCQELLSKLLEAIQNETCPFKDNLRSSDVDHMVDRFEQWSSNLGALQPGESLSLQQRLRDSSAAREAISKALHDLRDSTSSAIEIASGNRHNRIADPILDQDVDPDDYDISSTDSESLASETQKPRNRPELASTSEIAELLRSIKLSIDSLFRASYSIRNSRLGASIREHRE